MTLAQSIELRFTRVVNIAGPTSTYYAPCGFNEPKNLITKKAKNESTTQPC